MKEQAKLRAHRLHPKQEAEGHVGRGGSVNTQSLNQITCFLQPGSPSTGSSYSTTNQEQSVQTPSSMGNIPNSNYHSAHEPDCLGLALVMLCTNCEIG